MVSSLREKHLEAKSQRDTLLAVLGVLAEASGNIQIIMEESDPDALRCILAHNRLIIDEIEASEASDIDCSVSFMAEERSTGKDCVGQSRNGLTNRIKLTDKLYQRF